MKLKAIAAICRKTKTACIYRDHQGNQYIGNGQALYLVNGLPELDEESLLAIFDVPGKEREDWDVDYQTLPEELDCADNTKEEQLLQPWDLKVESGGTKLQPLTCSQGLAFLDHDYLKPLQDARGYITLTERYTPAGKLIIAVKVGLLLRALIRPEASMTADFVRDLERLAQLARVGLENEII